MKKKLLSLVMSFMMIFTCVIPISAQSTNRPAESSIVDILEDILGKELTTDLKLKAGSYAVVVTATKGTSTITSTVKSTALKTISPFTVDAVLPGANVVSGTGLKGATVKVVTSEFKTYTTTVDQNGKYSVKIPTQEEYDSIMVKISKDGYASKLKVVDVEKD